MSLCWDSEGKVCHCVGIVEGKCVSVVSLCRNSGGKVSLCWDSEGNCVAVMELWRESVSLCWDSGGKVCHCGVTVLG